MMRGLSVRDRRAIAAAAIVLAPALLFVTARPYVRSLAALRNEAALGRELLARERDLVRDAANFVGPTAVSLAALGAELPRVVHSEARATAMVQLADYVRGIARTNEVLLTQASEAPADSLAPGMQLLRLSVRAESDFAGVLRFLNSLERGRQRIRVTRLLVQRATSRTGPGVPADAADVLVLTATIEAPAIIQGPTVRATP